MIQPGKRPTFALLLALPLIFLAAALLLAQAPSGWASAPEASPLLCGKLVFIELKDSPIQELGLAPCGETKPLLFEVRPRELHNYYRFRNVEIESGMRIKTVRYGDLSKYIVGWDGYTELNSCGDCSVQPSATLPPTSTPQPSPTASLVPSPTLTPTLPPTPSQPPSAGPTVLTEGIATPTPGESSPTLNLPFLEGRLPVILLLLVGGLLLITLLLVGGGVVLFFLLRKKK
ncbi:MAG: hypothetical protein PHS96_09120 [Anaerolineales bacterium]|nr:hypothetical protein [Anaerolineales bacterium]